MKKSTWLSLIGFVFVFNFLNIHLVWAGVAPQKVAKLKRLADRGKVLSSRIPQNKQPILSSGTQRFLQLGRNWSRIEKLLQRAKVQPESGFPSGPVILKPTDTSDPDAPTELGSRVAGFTQSETSAGWCGDNAVIGFNDSGSLLEQLLVSPSGSFDFNGYAYSTDKGKNWTDLGFLPSDPVPAGTATYDLNGDPVIRCTDLNTFYYSSLATGFDANGVCLVSDISVSKSTNGGVTFGGPVPAASKDCSEHQLDKDWMAVDPTNANNVFVTYTDFDISGTSTACGAQDRTAIELVRSTNGGANWSAPVIITEVCDVNLVQGSNVIVDGAGRVYVAWEDFGADFPFSARQIFIRTSTNGGVNFGAPVKITDVVGLGVVGLGDGLLLQGGFRDVIDMPGTGLAVDRSGESTDGRLYACYQDGSAFSETDALFGFDYQFGDIYCRSSNDQGTIWSAAVRVNDDTGGPQNIDQFQPSVDVDRAGNVGVLFYDRRTDPRNFLINVTLATSKDGGASFKNTLLLKDGFAPVIANDLLIDPLYMGDYNAISTDFTASNKGFIEPFGENFLGDANVQSDKKSGKK